MNINVYYKTKHKKNDSKTPRIQNVSVLFVNVAQEAPSFGHACGSVTAVLYAPCKQSKVVK